MSVLFDAGMLFALYRPEAAQAIDPDTGVPVTHLKQRIDHLIDRLQTAETKVYIPSPALSEVLVRAGADTADIVTTVTNNSAFEVVPFGAKAALELALMTREALESGDKKSGSTEIWNKVKYDRQIIAIGRVLGVSTIYTTDNNFITFANKVGMTTAHPASLEIPDTAKQYDFLEQ